MPSADGPFTHKADLIETRLDDETILLDPTTQEMFSLTGSGPVIWDALRSQDVASVAAMLTTRFEVTPEVAANDVRELVARLLEAGLIEPTLDGR